MRRICEWEGRHTVHWVEEIVFWNWKIATFLCNSTQCTYDACARMCNMLTLFEFCSILCFPSEDFLSFCFNVNWPMCVCMHMFTHGINWFERKKFLNAWNNNSQIARRLFICFFYLQFVPVCTTFPSCWWNFMILNRLHWIVIMIIIIALNLLNLRFLFFYFHIKENSFLIFVFFFL